MQYEPRNPHHLRYEHGKAPAAKKLLDTVKDYVLKLNQYLGYDFNTVEFAVRDGVPIAIDFCNPAPDADVNSVGQENFEWVVETAASYAIERAKKQKFGKDNLTWGEYVRSGVSGTALTGAPKVIKADVSTGSIAKKAAPGPDGEMEKVAKSKKAAPKKK